MRWREAWERTRQYRTLRAHLLWAWRIWTGRYVQPGVYVEERCADVGPIWTDRTMGLIGACEKGPVNRPICCSYKEFMEMFGGPMDSNTAAVALMAYQFFENGGTDLQVIRVVKSEEA